jgi:YHS domain-containing protein
VTDHASETEIDPVCGMTVDMEEARADGRAFRHKDRTYGFCSKGCLIEFRESPKTYAEDSLERSID